jgi:hypothetical protein
MTTDFLIASVPLTKTITLDGAGNIVKSPYPNVYHVSSASEDTPDISTFYAALVKHAALGHCLLKGELQRPLVNESRAGSTDSTGLTTFICLDIDGLPSTYGAPGAPSIPVTPDVILTAIGLQDVSHVLQWSASHGLPGSTELRLHIFLMLTKGVPAPLIKQWLIHLNHTVPLLADNLQLSKTGHALRWSLDITACQNDKLLYIAPPNLQGIKNPMGRTPRISLVQHSLSSFSFPSTVAPINVNQDLTAKRIAALRAQAGLPARKFTTKIAHGTEVLHKPDTCTITGMRTERGFTYFNFNDGDSWAYFHPEDRADVIFNFKGEPNYLTKELLPAYWAQLTAQASRTTSQGLTYLAFLDRKSGVYYRGTYDASTDTLDLNAAKNETQIRHFAEQNGVPMGSFIAEWDMIFDPNNSVRVGFQARVVNTFQLTEYMRATPRKVTKCPPTIFKIVHNALGSDAACTAHFLNWLSFIVQKRTRTLTAWVLHGTEGTGKGILMNRILRPLLGYNQTTTRRMEEFNEPYNGFMAQTFLVMVDEIEAKALLNEKGVMAKFRGFITEPTIPIRRMYSAGTEMPNYTNWLFASNRPEPVIIPSEDRRFNVGKYQPNKLNMSDQELALVPSELQAFHDFLLSYALDLKAVATVLDNADRTAMIAVSQSSVDTVSHAILKGDFEFLLDQLPSTMAYSGNALRSAKVEDYKHALKTLMARTNLKTGVCNISRDELYAIFDYVVGNMPESPNKFTSLLKHHRIHTTKVWCDDKAVYGLRTTFKDVDAFGTYVDRYFPQPRPTTQPKPAQANVVPIKKAKKA